MDIEAVRNTLEQASLASLAIGLAIGFLFSFNPVALAEGDRTRIAECRAEQEARIRSYIAAQTPRD